MKRGYTNPFMNPCMNRKLLTFLFLLSLLSAACGSSSKQSNANAVQPQQQASTANANTQESTVSSLPADVLQASASKVELQVGKPAQAEVRLTIKEGYHINANPPSQYQIATQLTVAQAEGITAAEPRYPASITKKFSFSDKPLAVYEKEAVISVPLTAQATAAKGERTLPARLRFQACDDQVCYPKRDLQVSIPVVVK